MCVRDGLFIQHAPVVWLVSLADFQQIASDGAPSLIQRSCPQQHQRAVSHLPELQVKGTTWQGETRVRETSEGRQGQCFSAMELSRCTGADHVCSQKTKINYKKNKKQPHRPSFPQGEVITKQSRNKSNVKVTITSLNLHRLTSCQHVEVHLLNDFRSLLSY